MTRIAAVILLAWLIGPIEAAAQETAEYILIRTEEVYRNLGTYHFRGSVWYEWSGEDGNPRSFLSTFQAYRGKNGALRYQQGIGMSKVLAATDGTGSLLYLADKRQYKTSESSDLEAFIQKGLKVENAAWIFPTISLLRKYGNLKTVFHNPRLVSTQILNSGGQPVNCYVLEGSMEPADIDAVRGNRKTELWIQKDQNLVLREIHTGTSADPPLKGENLAETFSFDVAEPNASPAAEVFEFQPPQRAEEVQELFIYRGASPSTEILLSDNRRHPFYYELPFLKMKHFELPAVDGGELAMDEFRGKYVLLDFWATWCVPCLAQTSDLKRILRKYREKDLVVLGLNNEELDTTRAFLRKHKPAYPMLIDVKGELMSLYGVSSLPVLVLLDRSGNILARREERQTYKQIENLLKEAGL